MKKQQLQLKNALIKSGGALDEKQDAFITALEMALNEAIEANNAGLTDIIEDRLKKVDFKMDEALVEDVRKLGQQMEVVMKRGNTLTDYQKNFLRNKVQENHAEIVSAIKNKKEAVLGSVIMDTLLMVAAPHQNGNSTITLGSGVTAPLVENVRDSDILATIRRPENFVLDTIRNNQVDKVPNTLFKYEQSTTEEGAVTNVSEGAEKPLVQYKWVKNAISRVKIAGRIEWSEEFEMDNDRLFIAIVNMIERDVLREWNDQLLAAIIANATAYTTSAFSGTVTSATLDDVVIVLQALIADENYQATTVVLNPIDIASLMLAKDTTGRKLESMLLSAQGLGMNVIASTLITQGNVLIFDANTYNEIHSGLVLKVGQYDDQLIKNMWTLIAEMYFLLDTAALDSVATYYGTIATIAADIEVVPGP